MKIYTKGGDQGETSLGGGKRLKKDAARVVAYGEADELNSLLGLCRVHAKDILVDPAFEEQGGHAVVERILHHLQKDMFVLGADLASPQVSKVGGKMVPRISKKNVERLEGWIDEMEGQLKPLMNFILPGGHAVAAEIHVARTVCRRAERALVALSREEVIDAEILAYMNRLSDLLFVLARYVNMLTDAEEEKVQS